MDSNDYSFEQKSFAQLRPITLTCLAAAIAASLLATVIVHAQYAVSGVFYLALLGALLLFGAAWRCRSSLVLLPASAGIVILCVGCLGGLATLIGNPLHWLLPIGLVFSLASGAINERPWHFVLMSGLIWAILFYLIQPHFERQLDYTLTMFTIVSATMIGAAICGTYAGARRTVFDLQHTLQHMAYRDTLTGLPNRRAFMEQLEGWIGSPAQPLFFLMIDVDNFKKINDNLGHAVGDQVLLEIGQVLSACAAAHCYGRLGGEEFAVAAQLPAAAAHQLAQHIIDQVRALSLHQLTLSVSIGLAAHAPGDSSAQLMHRADEALYLAKWQGKNRYVMAEAAI